ncbi:ABC transporter permease [Amycolatopsis jejuensis]|uniref:ABC transporter permease n=1 Tax=Amycolatopsis jejuensis TaxID=330084 RepID=UPI00068E2139|nr:ABC transporter permease [Amycolatopsis jejuensis]
MSATELTSPDPAPAGGEGRREIVLPRESTGAKVARSWPVVNLIRIGMLAVLLGVWQLLVDQGLLNENLYGSPIGVWQVLGDFLTTASTWTNTAATMQAVAVAFVVGSLLGIICGLLIGASSYGDRVIAPLLVPINSIPRIALAPLFIAWFGLTITAKVVLAASIIFFVLVENMRGAVRSIDPDIVTMAKVIGLKRLEYVRKVVLPSAVPALFAGLRLAVTYSLLGVIASEMIAARDGLGLQIVFYSTQFRINYVWALLLELLVIATIIAVVFGFAERRLLRWQS